MGPKWVPNWSLGAPWEDPWGTPGVWGTDPAPGSQKVPQVCNCRQNRLGENRPGTLRTQILGTPWGLSKRPY